MCHCTSATTAEPQQSSAGSTQRCANIASSLTDWSWLTSTYPGVQTKQVQVYLHVFIKANAQLHGLKEEGSGSGQKLTPLPTHSLPKKGKEAEYSGEKKKKKKTPSSSWALCIQRVVHEVCLSERYGAALPRAESRC